MFDRAKEGSNGFVLFLFPSHVRLIRNAAGEAWAAGKRESVLIRSHSGLDDRFLSFITRNRAKPTLGYVETVFFLLLRDVVFVLLLSGFGDRVLDSECWCFVHLRIETDFSKFWPYC